jgi:uncharacterized surface protein with fasciclin (FAS1) repeats
MMKSLSFLLLLQIFVHVPVKATQSLLEVVESTPEFSTMANILSLLIESDFELTNFLYQQGPYTLFVPQDEGFGGLKQMNYLARLMLPAYRMHLYSLVHYQISDQNLQEYVNESTEKYIQSMTTTSVPMEMLTSEMVKVSSSDGTTIFLDSPFSATPAQILSAEPIPTTDNALVYATDNILLPEWMQWNLMSAMETFDWRRSASSSETMYTTFCHLLVAGNMDQTVRDAEMMTLLAPTNTGFQEGVVDFLLESGHETALQKFLLYHMVPQILNLRQLTEEREAFMTKQGEWLEVIVTERSGIKFNQAPLKGFHLAQHGVVYRLGEALIPPSWR